MAWLEGGARSRRMCPGGAFAREEIVTVCYVQRRDGFGLLLHSQIEDGFVQVELCLVEREVSV